VFLVDVRRPDEWEKTGVGVGANPIDMRRDDFIAELDKLTDGAKDAPVALICARGVRSARLSNQLTEAGYTNIIDVPEGMLGSTAGPGWLKTGLPTKTPQG
ncbi:MAG: rhodanese-like domain-containing protein, partial [Pseudomonadota bacterium]